MNWKICFSTLLLCGVSYAQSGPPSGYNVVVPAPSSARDPGQFGDYVDLVLDSNGDPALTYAFYEPSGTGNFSTSGLFFVRWDRAQGKWTTPVRIAQIGDNRVNGPGNVSSLSYDPSTNTFAVAYLVGDVGRIDYAASTDGGQTWRSQTVVTDNQYTLAAPQLAIGGGRAYLAFIRDTDGLRFLTGSQTTAPMSWASQLVPNPNDSPRSPFSLKLDNAGVPAVAFWAFPATGSSSVLGFWRPGYSKTVQVATTLGIQNDFIGVDLAFLGTNPRLALYADLDPAGRRSPSYASYSNDGGLTWAPAAYVTPDTGQSEGGFISLAIGSKGQGAIGLEHLGGNDLGVCGDPLVARSTDFVTWTTCTASGPNSPRLSASYPRVAFDKTDRLYLAFQNRDKTDIPAGVVLWYQPGATGSGPQISSGGVGNGASFTQPVAPGSLATIFGTNFLSGEAVNASATPLPTLLGNVSVTVNGRPAPLVYVGPAQINFQIPYETASGAATVIVTANNVASNSAQVNVAPVAPGIFVYGTNQAVVQNQDFSVNGPSRPEKPGNYIIIYATGGGQVDRAVATGASAPGSTLSNTLQVPVVTINNLPAPIAFAGLAPGFVGLMQINAQVPSLPTGNYPLKVTMGGTSSNTPNVAVQP